MKALHVVIGIALAVALPFLPVPDFWVTLACYVGLGAIVAMGLVLLTGMGGMTSFGQAAFVGLGAYATAYLSTRFGVSAWVGLVAGLLLTVIAAAALGALTTRLSGHFLPLGTIAWGLSLYFLFGNMESLGRYDGLTGIPPIRVGAVALDSQRELSALIWGAVVLCMAAASNLLGSRAGRAVRTLKGQASMAEAMGVNTPRLRMLVFVVAACFASLSGWLYAHLQRTVNPTPFGIQASIEYLLMAVLGGAGHVAGAILGAAVVVLGKNQLQDWLPRLFGHGGNYEVVVFGLLLVLLLQRARDGLWPWLASGLRPLWQRAAPAPAAQADAAPPPVPASPRREAVQGDVLLRIAKARKTFGGLTAVDEVSFDVHAGEVVALIGPNGAGKSTLFNLVTGVLPMTSGDVLLAGPGGLQSLAGTPARHIVAQGLARSFQHVKLVAGMSVLENVALGGHLHGGRGEVLPALRAMVRSERGIESQLLDQARQQIQRVGLAGLESADARSLALGQQRLVEVARALCSQPRLLLLDEPAAGLRHGEKQALAALLRSLCQEGMSILIVEHDMPFVMGLADRVVTMQFGRRIAQGTPAQTQADPAVQEAYLGTEIASRRRAPAKPMLATEDA